MACSVKDCRRKTRRGRRHCEMHQKRHWRGVALEAPAQPKRSISSALIEAALRLGKATTAKERQRATWSLLAAAKRFRFRALRLRPPPG